MLRIMVICEALFKKLDHDLNKINLGSRSTPTFCGEFGQRRFKSILHNIIGLLILPGLCANIFALDVQIIMYRFNMYILAIFYNFQLPVYQWISPQFSIYGLPVQNN